MINKNGNRQVFMDCHSSYEKAQLVLIGAPFDSTTSYRPGARFASKTIRSESYGFENYSPYLNRDLTEFNIYDAGDLELPIGDTKAVLNEVENSFAEVFKDSKIPLMIGGEHLLTLGAVKAALKKYPNLRIIQFDAHADLRDEYLGVKLSHATVMRRIWEITGPNRIYQMGIRSGDKEEFDFAMGNNKITMNKFDFAKLDEAIEKLKGYPVYLTIDLDVLDPSCFPGTGTPEAGGVDFITLNNAVRKVCENLQIIGGDMNELAPNYDPSGISTALACKLLRELILSLLSHR